MQKKAFLFAAAALLALGARPAEAQRRVRCESRDYRQQLCRAETSGGVRLARQLGDAACRQGRTWGTTRSGIWVSNGCRADFEVGRGGGGILDAWRRGTNNGDWNRGRNDDWNRGSNDDWNRGRNDDRNGGSFGNATARCRAAVASRLGTRTSNVNTWNQRQSGSSLELGWRSGRDNGTCRVDRNGRVSVSVDRNRNRDGDWDRNRGRDRTDDRDRDRGHDRDRERDGRRG